MKARHIFISSALFFLFIILYFALVSRNNPRRNVSRSTISHADSFPTVYTPIPVKDDLETEMGVYSSHVKARIRDIKRHLSYRPPLSILPFVRMMGHYIADQKYEMANCVVEKSMCTQMNGIFCYLYDTEGFLADNRTIGTETWWNTYCQLKNNHYSWEDLQVKVPKQLETTFIVRDPINRFISAFIDKCVQEKNECYGCHTNVTCVVEKVFESVMTHSRNHSQINDRRDMVLEMSYEGRHFAPLTWYCDLWDRFEEYHFIKYGEDDASFNKTRTAIMNFFVNKGVEKEKLRYIDEALNSRSSHATKTTYSDLREETEKILLGSHKHLEMMAHMYYYDFIAFGFHSPVDIYYPYS